MTITATQPSTLTQMSNTSLILARILSFVLTHDVLAAHLRGDAVVIVSAWYKPDTGERGQHEDTVRTMAQARDVLGY